MSQTPTPGRIVHVVLPYGGPTRGEIRPGLIVDVLNPETEKVAVHVHLNHRTDSTFAMLPYATPLILPLEAEYDATGRPGTWHWPARA